MGEAERILYICNTEHMSTVIQIRTAADQTSSTSQIRTASDQSSSTSQIRTPSDQTSSTSQIRTPSDQTSSTSQIRTAADLTGGHNANTCLNEWLFLHKFVDSFRIQVDHFLTARVFKERQLESYQSNERMGKMEEVRGKGGEGLNGENTKVPGL